MIKFNIEVNKQIHHLYETITVHPSYRDLGPLEDRHELHATLFLDDNPIATGFNIDDVSYTLPEDMRDNHNNYRIKLVIYRNHDVIAESFDAWLAVDSRLSSEITAVNIKTRGLDFFGTFIEALALMRLRFNENSLHPSERYKLFAWEVGPWLFELYWDEIRKGFELTYCPANDIESITSIEVNSSDRTSIGRTLLPLLDSPVAQWITHPSFRKAVIEEPLGNDLMYHYTFLMSLASANNPIANLPMNIRVLTNLTRKVGHEN